ncbi:MAG: response regulator, partial [Synergistaceae bacterium]|nr:response regulator [Synergistaceae bacterium]
NIYISDPATDELLFVSDGMRERIRGASRRIGGKCWRELKGEVSGRCRSCPIERLSEGGGLVTWQEHDEKSGRHFRNTDSLVKWRDGRTLHIQHSYDVTETVLAENATRERLKLQEIMSAISESFIFRGNIHTQVESSLLLLGNFLKLSQAVVYKYDAERGSMICRYEWYSKSSMPPGESGAGTLRVPGGSATFEALSGNHHTLLDGMDGWPGSTILLIPIIESDDLWGALGFSRGYGAKPWGNSEIQLGKMLAGILSGVLKQHEIRKDLLLMSSMVNSSPSFISYVNDSLEYEFINPMASTLTGYSQSELIKGGPSLIYDRGTMERFRREIIPLTREFGSYDAEISLTTLGGEERVISLSSFSIDPGDTGLASIANDITDRKAIERQLIEARDSADMANRAKSDFLSRMSHEMRTPLNAVSGMTSIALGSGDRDRMEYCLRRIESAAKHLLGVINAVLDMSKIEANKLELSPGPFNIGRMLDKIMSVTGYQAEQKRQKLTLETGAGVPMNIVGDEMYLSQAITNLLANSIKFTPTDGNVSLSIFLDGALEDGRIRLRFEVADDGIGISPEQQSKLFRSFGQADGSISHKFGGTGLGLAISKGIVELMGGSIWIESELGRGARFIFTVVVTPAEGTEPPEDGDADDALAAEALSELGGRTILVAEDIPINVEIVTAFLEGTNITVDAVENGQEAVDAFKKNPDRYDLILMDMRMPGVDGLEATEAIRSLPLRRAAETPIIAMTANVFREDIEKCHRSGMDDHIGKPFDRRSLLSKLSRHLGASVRRSGAA